MNAQEAENAAQRLGPTGVLHPTSPARARCRMTNVVGLTERNVMRRIGLHAMWWLALLALLAAEPTRAQGTFEVPDPAISAVVTGGHWEAGGRSGTIRFVVVTGGIDHLVSTLHAQWLADATATAASRVMRSVPVSDIPPGVWALESPRFELVDKVWRATIEGANTHTSPPERQRWLLTFGAPGDVHARPIPPIRD
jgi:hypothetical protein